MVQLAKGAKYENPQSKAKQESPRSKANQVQKT